MTAIQRVQKALEDLKNGKGILLLDDASRENECDLIYAAQSMSVSDMALMIRECSGIVCLVITQDMAQRLELPMMVQNNESKYGTGFTVSIEAKEGITTGVSASDRIQTIQVAIAEGTVSSDLARPGHVFPLVAREGGLEERRGHTEGSLELVKLAGLLRAAVLCELMNPDGTMAQKDDVTAFSLKHDMCVLSIQDIFDYRQGVGE